MYITIYIFVLPTMMKQDLIGSKSQQPNKNNNFSTFLLISHQSFKEYVNNDVQQVFANITLMYF